MQTFNKSRTKNIIAYTWFIYPVLAIILTLVWLWAFPAFHQPSAHQKLNVFLETDVKNESFIDPILEKYERENLREINTTYAVPGSAVYYQKLQIAMTNSDIFVLSKSSFEAYKTHYDAYFVEVSSYIKDKCNIEDDKILDGYGVLFRTNGSPHYLDEYMSFMSEDYYLAFSQSSKNLGSTFSEDNAYYDNALTFAKYLLEGVICLSNYFLFHFTPSNKYFANVSALS